MEMWALVKRLLAAAQPGQTFNPVLVMGNYLREIGRSPADFDTTREELNQDAEGIAEELKAIGLIQDCPRAPGAHAMLGSVMRTEFGEDLYAWLRGDNVVSLFQSMMVGLEQGEIRRMLHQLDS